MIETFIDRVRSFFQPNEGIVKEPRVIGPDEHGIDPELAAALDNRSPVNCHG